MFVEFVSTDDDGGNTSFMRWSVSIALNISLCDAVSLLKKFSMCCFVPSEKLILFESNEDVDVDKSVLVRFLGC